MVSFETFLSYFPPVELPITLNDDIQIEFSRNNIPFAIPVIDAWLKPLNDYHDELTEYVPCFSIPDTYQFHAVVYWTATMLNYHYVLATFTKEGDVIDKRILAGTYADNGALTTSVATVDEDWIISIASGQNQGQQSNYDPRSSKIFKLEMLPEGTIINPS